LDTMAEMKPVQLKVRSDADASATPACAAGLGLSLQKLSELVSRKLPPNLLQTKSVVSKANYHSDLLANHSKASKQSLARARRRGVAPGARLRRPVTALLSVHCVL